MLPRCFSQASGEVTHEDVPLFFPPSVYASPLVPLPTPTPTPTPPVSPSPDATLGARATITAAIIGAVITAVIAGLFGIFYISYQAYKNKELTRENERMQ